MEKPTTTGAPKLSDDKPLNHLNRTLTPTKQGFRSLVKANANTPRSSLVHSPHPKLIFPMREAPSQLDDRVTFRFVIKRLTEMPTGRQKRSLKQ